jgi:hypothetical protein
VLASTADSGVDLASQVVLYLCNRWACRDYVQSPEWPSLRGLHRAECHALSLQGNAETLGQLPDWAV